VHEDIERMLRSELRQVADGLEAPPLPALPAGPQARLVWPPALAVAAAAVLIALVVLVGGPSDRDGVQPAPQPTEVATDDAVTDDATDDAIDPAPEAVPTGPPTVPYVLDQVAYVGDDAFPGFSSVVGTARGWLAVEPPFVWSWGNGEAPNAMEGAFEQPPVVSPNGEYVAYITTEGEMNGFETAPAGEGMGLPVPVPVRDDDGVGTRIGAVTDEGWVIASGRGVGVLWRPFDGAEPLDMTQTAPDQVVWRATSAGLVVVDGSDGARIPGDGRTYLADVTAEGELIPIRDLPSFGIADISDAWVAWVPLEQVGGEVPSFGEILVQDLAGGSQGVMPAPDGWRFVNTDFTFEDDQLLVARVTDGQQQRMARCSPALQECVLLEAP
jgi:hypothetical protein